MKSKTGLYYSEFTDGKCRLHYGELMGYRTFDTFEDMKSSTLPWISKEMFRLSKRLYDLRNLQNDLLGIK